jgi:hypothetical protein
MPGLVPGIYVFLSGANKTWMARDKPGHDESLMSGANDRVFALHIPLRSPLKRKARPAAAGGGGFRIVHAERGADQVIDEIDFRAGEKA